MAKRKIVKRTALIGKPGTGTAWQEVDTFEGLPRGTPVCEGYVTERGTTGTRYGVYRSGEPYVLLD